jgi:hypothetical protein
MSMAPIPAWVSPTVDVVVIVLGLAAVASGVILVFMGARSLLNGGPY